jgi:electron transfer flavoprotein alpha subunit
MNCWIIIIDERRVGGMLNAARALGGQVTAAVVGSRALADSVAGLGFDRVLCYETAPSVPPEAYAAQVAEAAMAAAPRLLLASDVPLARILLGAAAAKLNAAVFNSVRALAADGEFVIVSRSTAEGKILEDIEVAGAVAGIFDGDDVEAAPAQANPVELMPLGDAGAAVRLIETLEAEGGAGLLAASRVVSVGLGIKSKNDLALIEGLAAAMHAEIGCSLPVCDNMRWLPTHRVVGSTHSQIAPELYIAVGISGQPQHLSGVRDAKIVVAINNDPEARVFKNCDYGITGDLYKIVPALTEAFKNTASSNS